MMSSLASLVVRRRRAVIALWAVVLVGAGTIGSSAFSVLSSSFGAGPNTESGRVTERLDDLAETGGEIAIIADGIDVDDPAVAASLAAGLDVYEDEPNVPASLRALPNTVLLPHIGSASKTTRAAMGGLVVDNLRAWFETGRALTPVAETPNPG